MKNVKSLLLIGSFFFSLSLLGDDTKSPKIVESLFQKKPAELSKNQEDLSLFVINPKQKITKTISLEAKSKYEKFKHVYARFKTNRGEIVAELYPQESPVTVHNFVELAEGTRPFIDLNSPKLSVAKRPFYDGLTFHRIAANFVIQGGCPKGNGTGGPGYIFDDETDNNLSFNSPGMLAMANSGKNTNGSQFFITMRRAEKNLGRNYTIFGKVIDGMEVVNNIERTPTFPNERPRKKIIIESVKIERVEHGKKPAKKTKS